MNNCINDWWTDEIHTDVDQIRAKNMTVLSLIAENWIEFSLRVPKKLARLLVKPWKACVALRGFPFSRLSSRIANDAGDHVGKLL